uniref:Uncharacterized protein n=1 Tax=Arundo donax TaxID=35708 RepID=A0A0A9TFE4_ARUDO
MLRILFCPICLPVLIRPASSNRNCLVMWHKIVCSHLLEFSQSFRHDFPYKRVYTLMRA